MNKLFVFALLLGLLSCQSTENDNRDSSVKFKKDDVIGLTQYNGKACTHTSNSPDWNITECPFETGFSCRVDYVKLVSGEQTASIELWYTKNKFLLNRVKYTDNALTAIPENGKKYVNIYDLNDEMNIACKNKLAELRSNNQATNRLSLINYLNAHGCRMNTWNEAYERWFITGSIDFFCKIDDSHDCHIYSNDIGVTEISLLFVQSGKNLVVKGTSMIVKGNSTTSIDDAVKSCLL